MTDEELLKEWNTLYARVFGPVKKKYEAICEIFMLWNHRKIDAKVAIRKLKALDKA